MGTAALGCPPGRARRLLHAVAVHQAPRIDWNGASSACGKRSSGLTLSRSVSDEATRSIIRLAKSPLEAHMKPVIESTLLMILSVAACLSISCGGRSSSGLTTGPSAILNGGTLATANSYWAASNCAAKVELTADGGAITSVKDTSGTTYTNQGTWAALGSNGAEMTGTTVWIDQLTSISGSTSSGTFAGGVEVEDNGLQVSLGNCKFAVQSGQIP